ncbi:CsxC family protein [Sporanaerobacter acetigenes]|uniref:CsxC family protein n=1 Tax=Sporanaerobacter acetigenes TaxID=165813 RepID=UPI003329BA99
MAEPIDFINISYVQFFTDMNCNDMDNNATIVHTENTNSIDVDSNVVNEETVDIESSDSFNIDEANEIISSNDSKDESSINMQCFDNRCGDDLVEPSPCVNVNSRNLDICPNYSETPTGIKTGVIAKIPVVLAQLTVPFHISSVINLPELVFEVKDIKKSLKVTQCILLQPTNILFIKGFVRQNIDYSTINCSSLDGVSGDIHHCTVDTPFECSTSVNFFIEPLKPLQNTKQEFQYLKEEIFSKKAFAEKDKSLLGDFSEFNQVSEEFFNECPFCKLLSSRIVEFDELINNFPQLNIEFPYKEKFFIQIEEKMVIEIKLEIIQNINVVIPPIINDLTKINIKNIIT